MQNGRCKIVQTLHKTLFKVQWHMHLIPMTQERKQRQKDHKFESSLGNLRRLCLKVFFLKGWEYTSEEGPWVQSQYWKRVKGRETGRERLLSHFLKKKNGQSIDIPSIPLLSMCSRKLKIYIHTKKLWMNIHNSITYNFQKVETTLYIPILPTYIHTIWDMLQHIKFG